MKKKVMIMLSILMTFTMCKKKGVEEITTPNEQINGHEYVDLGLPSGLKWATCNVGASSPSEYGNYYAWGEIDPKESYTQQNCLTWGQEMGDISGNPQYDAARANWGSPWRMPTKSEFEELIEECEWEWTSEGGNNGYKITGANGNSIFLPAAGYRYGTSLFSAGSDGEYWSSTPDESNTQLACYLYFFSGNHDTGWRYRDLSLSVRPVSDNQLIVTTQEVREIGATSAICGGEVTYDGGTTVTARGVCWSRSENPTITDCHTTDGSGTGSYTSNITGLDAGTVYYVRAYATNSEGTVYGSQKSFNTTSGQINGHEYVDLGLPSGLKWATCNVGASSPSEYGNYYAWGEIEPKESYTEENCLTEGQEIGDISRNPQYDAARANWGSTWRMPTNAEFDELAEECVWTWTSEGGSNGYKITGANGNSIFLPAADYRYGTSLDGAGSYGFYWSSTPYESYTHYDACCLDFGSDNHGTHWGGRLYGFSVRPVSDNQLIVMTQEVEEIGTTSAICGGEITDDGGAAVTARGVCWSRSENPTITDCHTTDGSGTGSYTSNMTGLSAGTVYYVRAYATNEVGTWYGSQKSFNTTNGQINGYDYVDLGLPSGLKWATSNVGASSPSEYGNYYAWGEIEPKESYAQQNCLTWEQEIGDISGNPQYDASRANWGGTWRMPTIEEFEELIDNCTWTIERGNRGYRVTGPNGNSIFLPAAGYRYGTSLNGAGSYGYYWSSTPNEGDTQYAISLYFLSDNYDTSWYYRRYFGLSVRPVSE